MTGGSGSDVFIYQSASDSDTTNGIDSITDFDAGTNGTSVDQIDIDSLVGLGNFTWLGLDADLSAQSALIGEVYATFNQQTKRLEIDIGDDLSAGADMEVEMQNVNAASLDESDFIAGTAIIN